jgi:hypothetical protein
MRPSTRALALLLAGGLASGSATAQSIDWRRLDAGLEFAEVASPIAAASGDSRIRILRADPERYAVELLNASAAADGRRHTARQWAQAHDLVAAINASLYQGDYRTSTALMRARRHVNNPRLAKHNAVLLFDRLDPGVPPLDLVDRTCRDLAARDRRYAGAVQGIRMISCHGANVWSQQPRVWSNAAVGVDAQGRLLLLHMRAPLSTHDFADALLTLPLGLRQTMYVEGGPEAQLYVNAGGLELEVVGSHGSSFAGFENTLALPIPNALGLRRLP